MSNEFQYRRLRGLLSARPFAIAVTTDRFMNPADLADVSSRTFAFAEIQNMLNDPLEPISRRELLKTSGYGMGSLAFASLLADSGALGSRPLRKRRLRSSPLAVRTPHFEPRAKRVIHLFMNGGPSQIDTFDPKPGTGKKLDGQPLPPSIKKRLQPNSAKTRRDVLFASPFRDSASTGESGIEVSELFPNVARHADDLCVDPLDGQGEVANHSPGLLLTNCGHSTLPRPSIGFVAAVRPGERKREPARDSSCFVPRGMPTAQSRNWTSAFLAGSLPGNPHRNREPLESS